MAEEKAKVSTRGLVEGGGGTPLRKFTGRLDSTYQDASGDYGPRNILNFKELDKVESVEPYPYPVAQIGIKASNTKSSSWGLFSESLNLLIPEEEDVDDQAGKLMTLEMEVGHIFGQDRVTGEDMLGNVWRVIWMEGAEAKISGGKSAADIAKGLLDGKNQPEFNQLAFQNEVIRADTEFLIKLSSGTFASEVLASGEFTKDKDGVFHKAEEDIPF